MTWRELLYARHQRGAVLIITYERLQRHGQDLMILSSGGARVGRYARLARSIAETRPRESGLCELTRYATMEFYSSRNLIIDPLNSSGACQGAKWLTPARKMSFAPGIVLARYSV
jgi:hypothetical protein